MRVIPKGLKLRTVLLHKCPKCQEGDLFTHPNPYRFKGYFSQPENCPVCGQKFEIEPGFYYGAMYVNYGASIAISVSVFLAMYFLGSPWESFDYVLGVGLGLVSLAPFTFRSGRAIWISMFVDYEADPVNWPNQSMASSQETTQSQAI